jgi:hypothetical protein
VVMMRPGSTRRPVLAGTRPKDSGWLGLHTVLIPSSQAGSQCAGDLPSYREVRMRPSRVNVPIVVTMTNQAPRRH